MKRIVTMLLAAMFAVLVPAVLGITDAKDNVGVQDYNSDAGVLYTTQLRYDPFPATPGSYIDVWYKVENVGGVTLENVEFELEPSSPFSLDSSSDAVHLIGSLGAHESALVQFRVRIGDAAVQGEHALKYTWRAKGYADNGQFSSVIAVRSGNALLLVSGVSASPASVAPASHSIISVELKNAGDSFLRYVTVSLGLFSADTGVITELPFTPVGSGVTQSVLNLAPGQKATLNFDLLANPDSKAKPYKIPLFISYTDTNGKNVTTRDTVGVTVAAEPDMVFYVDKNDLRDNVNPGDIVVKAVNKGRTDVKFLTITLQETDAFKVMNSPFQYIGEVNTDDYETALFSIKAATASGTLAIPIIINYQDTNGNAFNKGLTLNVPIRKSSDFGNGKTSATVWLVLVVIVIVVVVVLWRRKRSKRKA